jgi:hypothetical protein
LDGGLNLHLYVQNNPINFVDTLGLWGFPVVAYWRSFFGGGNDFLWNYRNTLKAKTINSCCAGYRTYFNSKCENECGELVDDNYPESAYKCCNDFVDKYSGNIYPNTVKSVATCLTIEESTCQAKKKCKDREDCRLDAHKKCYLANKFIPVKGIPNSCTAIGGYIF